MRQSSICRTLSLLFAFTFAIATNSSHAEARCPAGVANLNPRLVAGAWVVIPVKVNQSGPYDFLVDTGAQITVIDPALASGLGIKLQGTARLVSVSDVSPASIGILDSIEAGSNVVKKPYIVVQDLKEIQKAAPDIRGVLGLNFLSHFDMLIDYRHNLLCLDESTGMQAELHGEPISLVKPRLPAEVPDMSPLVIAVNLSDTGTRPILLQVDSGSDGAILYAGNRELEEPLLKRARFQGAEVDEIRRAFAVLPPQDMKLGSRTVRNVHFVTPVKAPSVSNRAEDGVLPTVLFQRVFISHSDRLIMFDPR